MATKEAKTETYVLLKGKHAGFDEDGNRKVFNAGDRVELTADQANAFKGKFKSLKQAKLEAQLHEELDPGIHATDAMVPSREQPLAPLEPVDPKTGELEDPKAQEAVDKQTNVPTTPVTPVTPVKSAK